MELRLLIRDFGQDSELKALIRNYYSLLDDYMLTRKHAGVLHTAQRYLPFGPLL